MEIQYLGGNTVRITTKKSNIVVDPVSDLFKQKVDLKKANLILATQDQFKPEADNSVFLIDCPGEYEFSEASVKGIPAQPHTSSVGDNAATMYKVTIDDKSVLIVGHVTEKLTEDQQEAIGLIDILIVPVGGNGYTLDAVGAANVVRTLEPKVIIPTHYSDSAINYEVAQQDLDLFVKELGADPAEPQDKFRTKDMPESLTIQPLIRQ